jgi:hypothetical protein
MDKATKMSQRWHTNASAVKAFFKVPKGWEGTGWFYTGPTKHFGHSPPRKGKAKK